MIVARRPASASRRVADWLALPGSERARFPVSCSPEDAAHRLFRVVHPVSTRAKTLVGAIEGPIVHAALRKRVGRRHSPVEFVGRISRPAAGTSLLEGELRLTNSRAALLLAEHAACAAMVFAAVASSIMGRFAATFALGMLVTASATLTGVERWWLGVAWSRDRDALRERLADALAAP
jgi:hypothetical protein